MELRQLRYFVAVAEERHFGRAAVRLHIAQPGLSQAIQSLERSLGARLFDREVRPVALTVTGEALLPEARRVIEAADRAMEVAAPRSERGGTLEVGIPLVGHLPIVTRLAQLFQDEHPEVRVRVHPAFSPQSVQRLVRGEIDIAIVHSPFEASRMPRYLGLGEQEIVLVVPESHRLAHLERVPRAELMQEPFLAWPRSVNPVLVDHICRALFGMEEPPNVIEVPVGVDGSSRARLIEEGLAIAAETVPLPIDRLPEREGVVYRRLQDPPALLEYGLAWFDRPGHPLHAFVRMGAELVGSGEEIEADPASDPGPSESLLTHTS
jgi:DNA-binding transcriptional LysR family regulator